MAAASAAVLSGCASTGDGTGGSFADSPPVVKQNTEAAVLDVRYVERGAIALATETAKSLMALAKPLTDISALDFPGL